jgi:hypothetical protein
MAQAKGVAYACLDCFAWQPRVCGDSKFYGGAHAVKHDGGHL